MPADWFIVGSKNKSASTKLSLGDSPPNIMSSEAALVRKQKETRAKFTFLELTKLISSRWREVCKNDPVTKEFCNKIASKEAARYKAELEEYRHKYGAEAAKGKKRKPRKSLLPEPQKKTKQVKEEEEEEEEGEICMLNNFVPVEGNLKEEAQPSPESDLEDGNPDIIVKMYARQQELQAQLEQRQRRLASLPLSSSSVIGNLKEEARPSPVSDLEDGNPDIVLKLLSGKDQTLLIRGNSLLVLNLCLHIVDGIGRLNVQSDGLTGECLDKNLHWR